MDTSRNWESQKFYSGTSGLVLPVPKVLYPPEFREKSRLIYYASLFNSIEINSSFYKLPKESTVAKWRDMVPKGFRFTFKIPKSISHARFLDFDPNEVKAFMKLISIIAHEKGCVLVQFPPSLRIDKLNAVRRLLDTLQSLDKNSDWNIAAEFRHSSWYADKTYKLLEQRSACMVIHDIPASATPLIPSTASFSYFRFHGPGGRYRGGYILNDLSKYATQIGKLIAKGKTVYCYFNNTMGDAVKDLQSLNKLVATDKSVAE